MPKKKGVDGRSHRSRSKAKEPVPYEQIQSMYIEVDRIKSALDIVLSVMKHRKMKEFSFIWQGIDTNIKQLRKLVAENMAGEMEKVAKDLADYDLAKTAQETRKKLSNPE